MIYEEQVVLPYEIPIVTNYPLFTAILGILTAHKIEKEWLYNNYILLWCLNTFDEEPYWNDFKFGDDDVFEKLCANIEKRIIYRREVKESVISVIKQALTEENYIFVSLDMFYIKPWWKKSEEREHQKHQVLIYGYTGNGFLTADFFCEKYAMKEIDFEDFAKAYMNFDAVNDVDSEHCTEIELFHVKNNKEAIDLKRIKGLVFDFIKSKDDTVCNKLHQLRKNEVSFGFAYYVQMKKYIVLVMKEECQIDIRPFYNIMQQSLVMVYRIRDIWGEPELENAMYDCYSKAKNIIFMLLLYNKEHKKTYLEKALFYLDFIIEKEQKIFGQVYLLCEK